MLSGPRRMKATAPNEIHASSDLCTSSKRTFVSFTKERSMTKLRRSMTICCLFLGVLFLAGHFRAQMRPPIVEQLAKTYGLDSYEQVQSTRHTVTLQLPALPQHLSPSCDCEHKTAQITDDTTNHDLT